MKKRWLCLILPAWALALETLPWGAVCCFLRPGSDGTVALFRELYSYFDFMPLGWGNAAPFVTAVLTCAAWVPLAVYAFTGRAGWAKAARYILAAAAAVSWGPLVWGLRYFSAVGGGISLALAGGFWVLGRCARGSGPAA